MSAAEAGARPPGGGRPVSERIDPAIAERAAWWVARLWSGQASADERAACARWRGEHPDHEQAWRRIEALDARLRMVPAELAGPALGTRPGPRQRQRRRTLVAIGLGVSTAGIAGWLHRREVATMLWADHVTATGEINEIRLPDGSSAVLGTATALDLRYSADERRLRLHRGELLVTTAPAPRDRPWPLRVACPEGTVEALGTRFMVRREPAGARVTVFEGAVEIRPVRSAAASRRLEAGQQALFDHDRVQPPVSVPAAAAAWTRGVLVAESMPLADLVAELARYRRGVLRCDPAVAHLRASGLYSLRDTDRALDSLARALPVRVRRLSPWWVTVQG